MELIAKVGINDSQHKYRNTESLLQHVSMLQVIMLHVIPICVFKLHVILICVSMLHVFLICIGTLHVIMLHVIVLGVVAPIIHRSDAKQACGSRMGRSWK